LTQNQGLTRLKISKFFIIEKDIYKPKRPKIIAAGFAEKQKIQKKYCEK